MDWINKFYSTTGRWWGPAEYKITKRDYQRAEKIRKYNPNAKTVLELGSSYGNTASVCAEIGFDVTAVELSDRADFSRQYEQKQYKGSLKIIKDDFYRVSLGKRFDVVTYWNGFGIGTDSDQRKLLKRIKNDWLNEKGIALIDIANPIQWIKWAGDKEDKKANSEIGYGYNISEKIDYDPVNNHMYDTWWETDKPDQKITQKIRCYSPVDLQLLLEGTGLSILSLWVGEEEIKINQPYEMNHSLWNTYEYLAVLK